MTNSNTAIREKAINIFADIFTAGGEAHEVGGQSFDQLKQSGYIDRKISDLTALVEEHYYPKEFTEWVAKMINIGDLWESQIEKGWILLPDPKGVQKRFKTTDELYQYYKENEQ